MASASSRESITQYIVLLVALSPCDGQITRSYAYYSGPLTGPGTTDNATIKVWTPSGNGKFPVFMWVRGTYDAFDNTPPHMGNIYDTFTEYMASKGYIAAFPDYASGDCCLDVCADSECSLSVSQLIGLPSTGAIAKMSQPEKVRGLKKALDVLCALPQADCSLGVAVAGHSQGGFASVQLALIDSRVSAVNPWSYGYIDITADGKIGITEKKHMSCLLASVVDQQIPKEKRRMVIGGFDHLNSLNTDKDLRGPTVFSGYDCPGTAPPINCIQSDGSGYYIISKKEYTDTDKKVIPPENVAAHCFFYDDNMSVSFDSQICPSFKVGSLPWHMKPMFDWLASAAKKSNSKVEQVTYGSSCPTSASTCLGSSGDLAAGSAVTYKQEKIVWEAGMKGHSHYSVDPKKTALFVIDPQKVYSACPSKPGSLPELLACPSAKKFDGHSPLCCEKFGPAIDNANSIAKQARKLGMPVFVHAHVYRGGNQPTNCGRICDFDVLGWDKWPMAFNLWSEEFPWAALDPRFEIKDSDYYAEKTTYSAMTQPVVSKLKALGIDTIIVTGFMAQYCSVTTSRNAHDLGFKVIYVTDANDGPIILQTLSGIDENKFIPFTLGVAIADTIDTAGLLQQMGKIVDDDDVKKAQRLYAIHWSETAEKATSSLPKFAGAAIACMCCFFMGILTHRLTQTRSSPQYNTLMMVREPFASLPKFGQDKDTSARQAVLEESPEK